MAIRIVLECGHTSVLRVRPTPEGYTHDWEVFVRGMDNADIHQYVEKVVFQLHESFPKPKRILKDPPFVIEQSGYAGFAIPIHIYLKNKDDGMKKIQILYDLNLQTSDPAYTNIIKYITTVHNPSEEFRRKLLKGGCVPVSTSKHSSERSETKTPTMVNKPKLSGSDSKLHKNVESTTEKKNDKPVKSERTEKEKNQEYKSTKDERKVLKPQKESEKPKDEELLKIVKLEKTEETDETEDGKIEEDRQKHEQKKRDIKDRRDSSKGRERKEKRERIKSSVDKQNNVPNASIAKSLSALLAKIPGRDSSDSAPSVDEDSNSESKLLPTVKKEAENLIVSTPHTEMDKQLSPAMPMVDIMNEKLERIQREKSKGSKRRVEEKETRKRKRKSDSKLDDEPAIKREKDRGHSTSPTLEPVSSSRSPVVVNQEMVHMKEERSVKEGQILEKIVEVEAEQAVPDSTNCTLVDFDMGGPPVFSDDYLSQLKDLLQKIMTLQDNEELQRVVQVIVETGQYEITKKTFDFDLCALDRRTVQRLQQLFASCSSIG